MGFGMALGGIASGLEAGAGIAQKNKALSLQEMELGQNKDYQNRSLGIREKELKNQQWQQMTAEAEKQIAAYTAAISELIPQALAAGKTPEQVAASIEPLLGDIDKLSQGIGKDSSAVRNQVNAQLGVPPSGPGADKIGATVEGIKAKIAAGNPLSPGEQKVYDDSLKMSIFDKALLGGGAAPAAAVAAPTPTPVKTETVPAPVPPLPASLVGKQAMWSPSKQRWYTPDGFSFNQQGVAVP